jgi:hypothetical protein
MDLLGDAINSSNAHKNAKSKDEPMEPVFSLLAYGPCSIFFMVIDPKVRRKDEGKKAEANSSRNGTHPAEDRNTFCKYKSEGSKSPD